MASLSLKDWSYVAQLVIAGAGVLAVLGAAMQVVVARTNARRQRAYAYADRFNTPKIIAFTARYTEFWKDKTFEDFDGLNARARSRLLVVPNLIEEMATTYNRKLIDRDVAAQMLGVLTEALWSESRSLVAGARQQRDEWVYAEWEEMQKDTARRRLAGRRKTVRRRARGRLLRGE